MRIVISRKSEVPVMDITVPGFLKGAKHNHINRFFLRLALDELNNFLKGFGVNIPVTLKTVTEGP